MTNEDTGPWALNVSKSGEAAAASSEARAAELEQFYAEGTTPLAETTPSAVQQFQDDDLGLPEAEYRVPYDADGNYHVPDYALSSRIIALEEFNKKLLAALKQHGFDTNKLFR